VRIRAAAASSESTTAMTPERGPRNTAANANTRNELDSDRPPCSPAANQPATSAAIPRMAVSVSVLSPRAHKLTAMTVTAIAPITTTPAASWRRDVPGIGT
jgi:hypothetical protein